MALVCMTTMIFKIPIPEGYAHLGNGFILLAAALLGNMGGFMAAGVGSALADLLSGYYLWIIPTLVIKSIMGLAVAIIAPRKFNIKSLRTAVAAVVGVIEMVLGYLIAGVFLTGSIGASLTQIPGLAGEGIVGLLIFYIIGYALESSKIADTIQSENR